MEFVSSSQPSGVHPANSRGWPLNKGLTEIRQSPFLWGVFCIMLYLFTVKGLPCFDFLRNLTWKAPTLALSPSLYHAFGRITVIFKLSIFITLVPHWINMIGLLVSDSVASLPYLKTGAFFVLDLLWLFVRSESSYVIPIIKEKNLK